MADPALPAADPISLRTRLGRTLIGAAGVLVLVISAAGVSLAIMRDRQSVILDVLFHAISEADIGHVALLDVDSAVRGYATTGNPIALETLDRLTAEVDPDGPEVESLLVATFGDDHPILTARRELAAVAGDWNENHLQPVIEAVDAGGPGAVTPAELAEGAVVFAEVDTRMRNYADMLRAEREQVVGQLDLATDVFSIAFLVVVSAALGAGLLLWRYLRRWVTEPLAAMALDVRRVASGEIEHAVTATGPGEVGDVARDVELMRARLALLLARAAAAQEELAASHAALEEQTEELRRSNRDLEQFAYVASHDLQEPLRKVASFTQLLAKRYGDQLDDRAQEYIAFAVDGATRMQRLISDLLGFSRVGRIGGEVSDVVLTEVLAEAIDDLREAIDAAGATVTAGPLPTVRGERPLLVQLVTNLIGNAVKFRDPERPAEVRLDARQVGEHWELRCSDNGIGIDPQYAERVFVIFQRLHARDVYEGTGIGLAVCKRIVEYHGGDIWIEPGEQHGTTVAWTLPSAPGPGTVKPRTPRTRTEEEHA
jgi:signal transduction histidine kinase